MMTEAALNACRSVQVAGVPGSPCTVYTVYTRQSTAVRHNVQCTRYDLHFCVTLRHTIKVMVYI